MLVSRSFASVGTSGWDSGISDVLDHDEGLIKCSLCLSQLLNSMGAISRSPEGVVPSDVRCPAFDLITVKLILAARATGISFIPRYLKYR